MNDCKILVDDEFLLVEDQAEIADNARAQPQVVAEVDAAALLGHG